MPTYSHDELGLDPEWWPAALGWHSAEPPVANGRLKLALVENPGEVLKHRHVYAALGDPAEARRLVGSPGFKGHDPDSSGPHPAVGVGEYEPLFWVFTDGTVVFEPLALRWDSGGIEVVLPEQGLLMTYGLAPRYTADQIVHWDDPEEPERDVIIADTSTSLLFGDVGSAFVDADANLIRDYSSLRGLSVVQVYYVETAAPPEEQVVAILRTEEEIEIEFPGRTMYLKQLREGDVLAQCWGIRLLFEPGDLPITQGRRDYATLDWPGAGMVTREDARMAGIADHASEVFVRDTVLARFEGQPDIEIHPETGAVSYKNQWGVSWCQRYGRDLIRVDLKKLYEGNRPEIVLHYHQHAVEPPPLADRRWDEPNVATRAKRIALAWADLGGVLSEVAYSLGVSSTSADLVGVTRSDLEYRGWWSDEEFERIARHIPPGLSRDDFAARCAGIYRSTIDRVGEGHLRRIVHALGFDPEEVREYRSLKLLALVVGMASLAMESGLDLVRDRAEVVSRFLEQSSTGSISALFKLNEMRQLDSHAQGSTQAKLDAALREFGIDPLSTLGGFDVALDAVYDIVADCLDAVVATLRMALDR